MDYNKCFISIEPVSTKVDNEQLDSQYSNIPSIKKALGFHHTA